MRAKRLQDRTGSRTAWDMKVVMLLTMPVSLSSKLSYLLVKLRVWFYSVGLLGHDDTETYWLSKLYV